MIVEVSFSSWDVLTPEQLEALKSLAHGPLDVVKDDAKKSSWEHVGSVRGNVSLDLSKFQRCAALKGLSARVVGGELSLGQMGFIVDALERMEAQVGAWSHGDMPHWSGEKMTQQLNKAVHVHVPNIGLLMMSEVEVHNDMCSDQLQRELDEGWRILAICPQPNQRRPDYVLGRVKPDS